MMNRKKVGLDQWSVNLSPDEFLRSAHRYEVEIYDITYHKHSIQFYAALWQRNRITHAFHEAVLITTTGMVGYFFRSMRKPYRVAGILLSVLLWYGLSHVVFAVEIRGEHKESQVKIRQTLESMDAKVPFYQQDVAKLKSQLKKKLEDELAWLEIQKQGSRYIITYTPKEFASISSLGNEELIAQEDGVIAQFDIQHGSKEKRVNDFVHKGDVLVSNVLLDSTGITEEVYVKGRVFAYTWKDITVTMEKTKIPKSFQYFQLLFDARREVSKDFKQDDKIYKENILQFSTDMGKIKMVLHYTIMKDITTP